MTVKESAIESYLVGTLEVLGGSVLKFTVPGRRGYPDRLCKLPGGDAFFVELKRPKGGVVAKLQIERAEELRAVGYRVYLGTKTRGEVDAILKREISRANREVGETGSAD